MARIVLLFLLTMVLLVGCTSAPAAAPATPVVTLSGAFPHPTPPMVRDTDSPAPTAPMTPPAASLILTPTAAPVLLPTVTPTPSAPFAAAVTVGSLPANYRARGAFASTTTFTGGDVQKQNGEFSITHVQAANAYGANESYELTTRDADGSADTVAVYQIDDHVAVRYAEDEWMVLDRATGSDLVIAIQPITSLARNFGQVRAQAQNLGVEEVNGIAARHLRIDDATRAVDAFGQPFFQASGQIESLRFDAWVTEPQGLVVRYTFDMEVRGSRVLNPAFEQVTADQHVAWTFDVLEMDGTLALAWPDDAPTPGIVVVPGFAPGEFPLLPDTQVVSIYGGLPELASASGIAEVSDFYQAQLMALGWSVEGDLGLLRCAKDDFAFQLLITADAESDGSRITILPVE